MMVRKVVRGAAIASALGSLLASGMAYAAEKKDKTTEKTVWYLVGTSPSVTVFRDMFRR